MNATTGQTAMQVAIANPAMTPLEECAYAAREVEGYFRHASRNEAVVRFVGIVIVLGAFTQWLLPDGTHEFPVLMTKVGLSVAFSVIGISIYSFAMRGSRYELALDPTRKDLTLSRLDRRDNVRSKRRFPLDEITSIYVLKSDVVGAPSKMRIRLRHSEHDITALRGDYDEIEMMHRALCRRIRMIQA